MYTLIGVFIPIIYALNPIGTMEVSCYRALGYKFNAEVPKRRRRKDLIILGGLPAYHRSGECFSAVRIGVYSRLCAFVSLRLCVEFPSLPPPTHR
jgi:hypothetical protein